MITSGLRRDSLIISKKLHWFNNSSDTEMKKILSGAVKLTSEVSTKCERFFNACGVLCCERKTE